MKYFEISNDKHSIKLPSLTFGAGSFDKQENDKIYFEYLDKYVEVGGNCIDTARYYCSWIQNGDGASENTIGRWMKQRNNRSQIIVSSKGGHQDVTSLNKSRITAIDLNFDIDESLKALQTDYIDIYFLHKDDENTPVSVIMPILNAFITDGKARFLGASNWTAKRIEEANKFAVENGLQPFSISQISYSLANTTKTTYGDNSLVCMDTREFDWYKENNFPVMAFSPQAKGFFSKLIQKQIVSQQLEHSMITPDNLARLGKVQTVCEKTGHSPAAVVLGYLSSQPFFVSSVFSSTKLSQLEDSLTAADVIFPENIVAFLENRTGNTI